MLDRDNPLEFVHRSIPNLRCVACHPRDNKFDLISTLEPAPQTASAAQPDYDSFGDPGPAQAGSVHLGRPPLTWVGEKLQPDWLQRFLSGTLSYKPRPDAQGRMPAFPDHGALLAIGLAHEHGLSAQAIQRPTPDPNRAEKGRRLTLVGEGFGCGACHPVGNQPALAGPDTASINFEHIADRLRPDYYWRYLRNPQFFRPGTMMPNFINPDGSTPITTIEDGDSRRQFDAIWHYLLLLRSNAAP
jgi:hypothetical protein